MHIRTDAEAWLKRRTQPDLLLPKLLRNKKTKKLLDFTTFFAPVARRACSSYHSIAALGYEAVDNTAEEIRDVTIEMLDRLDGVFAESDAARNRQETYQRVANRSGVVGVPKAGRDFLKQHADLLRNEGECDQSLCYSA